MSKRYLIYIACARCPQNSLFYFIATKETETGYSIGKPSAVHRNNQDDDTTNSLDEDDEDIDQYFNDLFPDRNRLDTVEEG